MTLVGESIDLVFVSADVDASRLSALAAVLSADEKAQADRFHGEADRRRSVVGRAALRHLLARRLGSDPREFRFERGAHGKPFLGHSATHFNVSHSGGLIAITLAAHEVGVDIEKVCAINNVTEIAARFFSRPEEERVRAAADPIDTFVRIWTMKEAIVKAAGGGMLLPLDRFAVPFPAPLPQALTIFGDASMFEGWAVMEVDAGDGYHAAVAAHGSGWDVAVRWENAVDLVR